MIQKALVGPRQLTDAEREAQRRAVEKQRRQKVIQQLIDDYKAQTERLTQFIALYEYMKKRFDSDIPQEALPYPQDAQNIKNWLEQVQATITFFQENHLDLDLPLSPTKLNVKLLLRGNKLLEKHLHLIASIFFTIRGRIKYKTDAALKIHLNEYPAVRELVAEMERVNP